MKDNNRPTGAERLFSKISDEEFAEELSPSPEDIAENPEDEPVSDDDEEEYTR